MGNPIAVGKENTIFEVDNDAHTLNGFFPNCLAKNVFLNTNYLR